MPWLWTKKPDLTKSKNQPGWAESQMSARLSKQLATGQLQLATKKDQLATELAEGLQKGCQTNSIKQVSDLTNIIPRTPKKVLDHFHKMRRNPESCLRP